MEAKVEELTVITQEMLAEEEEGQDGAGAKLSLEEPREY